MTHGKAGEQFATNTHAGGDGSDHADVATNTTHSGGDGSDHADVATNTTHSGGDGSDHADVATNTTHGSGNGSDHANVATNTTHGSGDGSDHADVATNTTDIATNVTAIGSNTTHRGSNGSDHSYLDQAVTIASSPTFANTTITTEINTAAWADYGGTSTIVGWSGTPTKNIWYKKVGKLVFVKAYISGTSDSTSVTFTLPYTSKNSTNGGAHTATIGADNGADCGCSTQLPANNDTVTCYKGTNWATWGNWTNSGTKTINANFFYEAA